MANLLGGPFIEADIHACRSIRNSGLKPAVGAVTASQPKPRAQPSGTAQSCHYRHEIDAAVAAWKVYTETAVKFAGACKHVMQLF